MRADIKQKAQDAHHRALRFGVEFAWFISGAAMAVFACAFLTVGDGIHFGEAVLLAWFFLAMGCMVLGLQRRRIDA